MFMFNFDQIKKNFFLYSIEKAIQTKVGREIILREFEKKVYEKLSSDKNQLPNVQLKKYQWVRAFVRQLIKNFDKNYISKDIFNKTIYTLGFNNFFKDKNIEAQKARIRFKEKYGADPPLFITLSPTQKCNLKCIGCYASSSPQTGKSLPASIVARILKEVYEDFGSRFLVISGGEPLLYSSEGKTLFDFWEQYNDVFCIFYTNGTLIDKKVAERLAKLGNAFPQISVEGFEKETDERRGKGVFKKILKAMENLREVGVPFAVSVTATTKNLSLLLSDEFYQFWFEEQGASYMWIFQLMPIGRGKNVFDLMPSPEQRIMLYRKWEKLLEKGYPIADFWNSGPLANGCIAFGRQNGYFYIDWNGYITPCVFIPYYVDNIYEIYKEGKTLADAWNNLFFKNGRQWQKEYGYPYSKNAKNWLMPCAIRDNYHTFRTKICTADVKPENQEAEEAMNSEEYYQKLVEYDKQLEAITLPIWRNEYLKNSG